MIYINDLPLASDIFSILMYADDTTLFCNFDNIRNNTIINTELEKVYGCVMIEISNTDASC